MGANGQIGIGIVGCGDGGMSNLRSLKQIPGVRITAVCDLSNDRILAAAGEVGRPQADVYQEYPYLIDDPGVELVVVATPDDQHLAPARAALEAGKHVFVEKPVATTLDDLVAFRELAEKFKNKLLFGEKYSWAHPVQAAWAQYRVGDLGEYMTGETLYTMWNCGRIMGGGKWRTESAYNPAAGGLSHNFMIACLFGGRITRISAWGDVLTYRELEKYGGFDTMGGCLELHTGRRLNWLVCLAIEGPSSPFAYRTVTHTFQFRKGALVYGPAPESDRLIADGALVNLRVEPTSEFWPLGPDPTRDPRMWLNYNLNTLYGNMWRNLLASIRGEEEPLHTIEQGINVAAACALAFESAKQGGRWIAVPF